MPAPSIVVVGSLNVDRVAKVEALPRPGETVMAAQYVQRFGGKGANQALAAQRCGASVSMLGCVGDDPDGHAYLAHLRASKIDTTGIQIHKPSATGCALIAVNAAGENQIIVALGANLHLTNRAVRRHRAVIHSAKALLLQLEVPLEAAIAAMALAAQSHTPIVFNPSPWRRDFPWGTHGIGYVIVNELEAENLLGFCPARATGAAAREVHQALPRLKIGTLIITRGARPTLCFSAALTVAVPTRPVTPIDTVGAGDAFAGAFTAALAQDQPVDEAIRWANCAGALSTLKLGAQEALPTRAQVRRALRELEK